MTSDVLCQCGHIKTAHSKDGRCWYREFRPEVVDCECMGWWAAPAPDDFALDDDGFI